MDVALVVHACREVLVEQELGERMVVLLYCCVFGIYMYVYVVCQLSRCVPWEGGYEYVYTSKYQVVFLPYY